MAISGFRSRKSATTTSWRVTLRAEGRERFAVEKRRKPNASGVSVLAGSDKPVIALAFSSSSRKRGPIPTGLCCETLLELQLDEKMLPCGYGSRRSPGRRGEGSISFQTALFNVTATLSIVIVRRLSPTRSGMTGRSSIPETVVLESRGRGVLDVPHSRGMTAEKDTGPCSRGTKCPSYWKQSTLENKEGPRECRMRVAPVAACAEKKHRRQQPGVHRISRHSLHNGFNGFLRALPGDRAFLPPSPRG